MTQQESADHRDGHPELEAEQAYIDHALDCLAAMQRRANEMVEIGDRAVRDEDSVDAKVTRVHLGKRVDSLQLGSGPLCFGRIDTEEAERWYVGRRHVEEADNKPVVIDWRAPVAAPYYRATAVDPCGLTFRRRFSVTGNRIEAIFDEDLSDPESAPASGIPDPLLAELDRSRSGQMSDIVATIAAEQDVIIRAPLSKLLVVQGGPGTGKTAVGLHRAAFLLYQHRLRFLESNVLVLGPNPLFLRYIADVLPSLGETSVRQTTLPGLLAAKYRLRAEEPPEVAELKGRAVMAQVIDQAIRTRISAPADGVVVRTGVAVVRFEQADLESMMKTILNRPVPVNDGREVFRRMVMADAWRRYAGRADVDPGYEPTFSAGVRASVDFKKAIDRMWPRLGAATVVNGLYTSAVRLKAAADGLLSADEQKLLARKGARGADEPWTSADLALLDECEARCDGVPHTYGHVIVDEAQDLSPMALRMIGRRAPSGSLTVLGDLAQATLPGAPGSWEETIEALVSTIDGRRSAGDDGNGVTVDTGPEDDAAVTTVEVQLTELTVGYRVPAAILEVANRLLIEAAPTVTPARSVRPGGKPPQVTRVADGDVTAAVVAELVPLREQSMSIAIIACEASIPELVAATTDAGIPCDRVGGSGLPGHEAVAVLDPLAAKGLEFDAVVVVEPGAIAELPSGLRHLYVAMTRAVQYLGLVAGSPLPDQLGAVE
jgi:DNA helicase IV